MLDQPDGITILSKFIEALAGEPIMLALEAADTISGGHIKEAAKTSDAVLGDVISDNVRNAALEALDLARLNNSRLKPIVDLLGAFHNEWTSWRSNGKASVVNGPNLGISWLGLPSYQPIT